MIKLCQSGRTEVPLPPMILCLTVPPVSCFSLVPSPSVSPCTLGLLCFHWALLLSQASPWLQSPGGAGHYNQVTISPGGEPVQLSLQLLCVRHATEPPRGPCAGCDLISGAILYPGKPQTAHGVADRSLLVPHGEKQLLLQSWC